MADEETPLRSEDGATEGQAKVEETTEAAAEAPAVKDAKAEVKEETPAAAEAPADKPAEKKELSGKFADLIKQIEQLSVLELSDLVKALEERFGVSAAAPMMAMGAMPAAGGAAAEAADEGKAIYSIHLTDAGAQKIAVIKAIREIRPDLGLKEAKDLVDAAPKEVKPNVPKDEAEEAKKKLEAAGAKVELK